MATLYLANRLDALRNAQNADGGWGFYAGKQHSWLEPTVYAALALDGDPSSDKAWQLVRSWQLGDGSWKLAANVAQSNWTSSLGALLATVKGAANPKGLAWLQAAAQGHGWAWSDETEPAAEPTAWGVLALLKSQGDRAMVARTREWLLSATLTPESCGPLLAAMQGTSAAQYLQTVAAGWAQQSPSRLTRARLTLGLRLNGVDLPDAVDAPIDRNLAVVALEALGAREGRYSLLRTEVA